MNETRSVLLVIDMQKAYVDPRSPLCIAMAGQCVPVCKKVIASAREKNIPVIFVRRLYRGDGSDIELSRYDRWIEGGRSVQKGSTGMNGAEMVDGLKPQPGDYTIVKPRWSAFFMTELDLLLRRLKIENVILIGATTPNCIRTTAYDASALEYRVIVIEDACASANMEIQNANIGDLKRMGAVIMSAAAFESYDAAAAAALDAHVYERIEADASIPETFETFEDGTLGIVDRI